MDFYIRHEPYTGRLFCSKDIAILECFKSNSLRVAENTTTATEHRFLRLCASLCDRGHALLRGKLHTRSSQGKGAGDHRLSRRRDPPGESGRNKEDKGLGRVRTNGGPPDENSGAAARPPSCYHRQGIRRPDDRRAWSDDLLATGLFESAR